MSNTLTNIKIPMYYSAILHMAQWVRIIYSPPPCSTAELCLIWSHFILWYEMGLWSVYCNIQFHCIRAQFSLFVGKAAGKEAETIVKKRKIELLMPQLECEYCTAESVGHFSMGLYGSAGVSAYCWCAVYCQFLSLSAFCVDVFIC